MDEQQAQAIIKNTFESSFDKSGFTNFIKNLLNRIDDTPFIYQGNYIPDAYKQYIKTLERIGKFSDGENRIDILVITLQKDTSLERARTMQRNFIAWYLNGSRGGKMKEAALAAFVSPGKEDWRFSLVKMDYKFEQTKSGSMKVKEEFTPARRWSFLVGANEKSHTAQSRLVDILKETDPKYKPTLAEIEKAFDIETVTKEFFLKYRELFLRTKEELDRVVKKDPKIKADFEAKGVDTVNFAKKLLGQIIFLYFLQKKGWFGVGRDDDWNTGSKHFLRELFEKKHSDYNNFFNDILEPLFYDALRNDRSHDDGYYSRFNCKIPFLNGGLFDPIGNYDWVHTDIIIPDRLFSNQTRTKEGDIGTGILDVFDRYNFTVKEDEPLEKEVAIDPELLGKSYEKFNAIRPDNFVEFKKALKSGKKGEENKFNKKFGVYYTPREIVHYMCQQSLINYLDTAVNTHKESIITKPAVQKKMFGPQIPVQQTLTSDLYKPIIPKKDIEKLIHTGELVSENEAIFLEKEQKIKKGEQKTTSIKTKLPDSIRKNAKLIDDKLAEITVCDPAVGSGAFPVGMMSEIVKTRNVLSVFLNDKKRKIYNFKRRCIEHSLYGVDIDPGAVEIAKLRLWLSLVVDEDDIKNIKPLPNLDYRIMQGNALISEFMGINFDSDKEQNGENLMFKDETDKLIEQFQQKKDQFLNESNVSRKSKLKEEVDDLLVKIFETKLKTQKVDYFNRLKNIENKYSVLRNEKQKEKLIKEQKEKLYKESGFDLELVEKQLKEFTSGKKIKPFFLWNLYFSEVFHSKGGFDVVIANPPYITYKGKQKIDVPDEYVKLLLKLYSNSAEYKINSFALFIEKGAELLSKSGILTHIIPSTVLQNEYLKKIRKHILSKYHLSEIVTFGNKVFEAVTDSIIIFVENEFNEGNKTRVKRKNDLKFLLSDKISIWNQAEWNVGNDAVINLRVSQDENIFLKKIENKSHILDGYLNVYVGIVAHGIKKFLSDKKLNNSYNKYLQGKHIERYGVNPVSLFVNFDVNKLHSNTDESVYLQDEKLLVRKTGNVLIAAYDDEQFYTDQSIYNLYSKKSNNLDLKYLITLLNSKLMNFYFNKKMITNPDVYPYIKGIHLKKLPVKEIIAERQSLHITLADRILAITKSNDYNQNLKKQAEVKSLEAEIDQLVYKLYELTPEEIKIVEGAK